MTKAFQALSEAERQRVESAVDAAEAKTSAEITAVVAAVSGRYERSEGLAGLVCAMLTLSVAWLTFPREHLDHGSWPAWPLWVELVFLLGAVFAGFAAGCWLVGRFDLVRRLVTDEKQMREHVTSRANDVFFDGRSRRGHAGPRLLLYVSLFERMVSVVADGAVLEKLGQAAVDELCAGLTRGLSQGDTAGALCDAVEEAGRRLANDLPRCEGQARKHAPEQCVGVE